MISICSIDEFKSNHALDTVILIGAGKMAKDILATYDWNIKLAVDNNTDRAGEQLLVGGKSIDVHPWNALYEYGNLECILLITPMMVSSLIDQIDSDERLRDREVYIYQYMLALQWDIDRIKVSKRPFSLTTGVSNKIPKIIHYFWFSGDPYPEKVQKCIDSWKKYCPDYEFRKWSLDNYHTDNIFCNEALSVKSWAFASDYGRCDVLRKYGGIYLDVDVELIKPLDDLLYDDGFFIFESAEGVDPGSGMGAVQGHSIFDEICNQYENLHFINEDGSLNKVNIIPQYTNVLKKHGLVSDGSYQIVDGIAVYPPLVLSPYSYNTDLTYVIDKTYGIHHWVSSWITDERRYELELQKKYISQKIKTVEDLFSQR
jgi:hypothetical protein